MKKLIFTAFLFIATALNFNAFANDGDIPNYWVQCDVQVAPDSEGRGTVYIDAENSQLQSYLTFQSDQLPNQGWKDVTFRIITTPAPGYQFTYFTDQNGNIIYKSADNEVKLRGEQPYISAQNPKIYVLSAHFAPEGDFPDDEVISVTFSGDNVFGTFMAPIAFTLQDGLQAYKVTGVKDGAVTLEMMDPHIPAFTAVLIENFDEFDETITGSYNPTQLPATLPSMTTGLLTGTIEDITIPEGKYYLDATGYNSSTFVKATPATEMPYIDAYTCYLSVDNGADSYSINVDNAEAPEVGAVDAILNPTDGKTVIYDLQGRQLPRLQKGINIVNGVKVIVK